MVGGMCEICLNAYDEQKFVPKVLDCGHSLCNVCIRNMLKQSKSSCPYCRKRLQKATPHDYPTNFSLLALTEDSNRNELPYEQLKQDVSCLKLKLIKQINAVSKMINDNNAYLSFLEDGLSEIEELENSEVEDVNLADSFKLIRQLESETKKPRRNALSRRTNCKSGAIELNLNDFDSAKDYLLEVFKRMEFGEQFFAANNFKDQISYGKISIWENMMFVHSLTTPELPEDAKLVWFQDLNACVHAEKTQVFIKMSRKNTGLEHLVMIQLEKTPLTHQFIKLCSGECGGVYKGAPYRKVNYKDDKCCSLVEVPKYISNGTPKTGRVDYASDSTVPVKCNVDDIVLFTWEDGSFVFSKCTQNGRGIDIIGKVVSPNLEEFVSEGSPEFMNITDSGIIYNLTD